MSKGIIRVLVMEDLVNCRALEKLTETDCGIVIIPMDEPDARTSTSQRANALIARLDQAANRGPLVVGAGQGAALDTRDNRTHLPYGQLMTLLAPNDCYWPSGLSGIRRGQQLPYFRQIEFRGKGYRAAK